MADETIEPQFEIFKILTMIDNRLTNIESEFSAVHDIRDLLEEIRNELKR
jgi:hypothetical protein